MDARLSPDLDTLPSEYRVQARNLARHSGNRIHDDAVARTYGYAGGLVTGTTVYGYLTHPLVAAWGPDWLERGVAHLRLSGPVYDREVVRVRTRRAGRSGDAVAGELALEVEAVTGRNVRTATASAGLAWGGPQIVPDPAAYPVAPLPATRPAATAEIIRRLDPLGSPELELTESTVVAYADEIGDALGLYRGTRGLAHPGLLLQQANRALSENVALGPWVHAASDLAHCGLARVGDRLVTRGRVARVYERNGRDYVELDVLVAADRARPILHVRHTAIWRLAAAASPA